MEAMIWLVLPMLGIQSFWPTEEFGIYAVYFVLGNLVAIALSYILLKVTDMFEEHGGIAVYYRRHNGLLNYITGENYSRLF